MDLEVELSSGGYVSPYEDGENDSADASGGLSGQFTGFMFVTYYYEPASQLAAVRDGSAVPEPASMLILLAGSARLVSMRRRR